MIAAVRDMAALKSAARAAIVIPAVFAFADTVIGQAADVDLCGIRIVRDTGAGRCCGAAAAALVAYLGLAVRAPLHHAGDALLAKCVARRRRDGGRRLRCPVPGVISGYVAAVSTGVLLIFVLPVTFPAPNSAIPDRLEGWGWQPLSGICAVMLLWPPHLRADLQRDAAGALRAVADVAEAGCDRSPNMCALHMTAVDRLGQWFLGTPHRPTGSAGQHRGTGVASGRARLAVVLPGAVGRLPPDLSLTVNRTWRRWRRRRRVLRASAERLEGRDERPDFHGSTRPATPSLGHSCAGCRSYALPASTRG